MQNIIAILISFCLGYWAYRRSISVQIVAGRGALSFFELCVISSGAVIAPLIDWFSNAPAHIALLIGVAWVIVSREFFLLDYTLYIPTKKTLLQLLLLVIVTVPVLIWSLWLKGLPGSVETMFGVIIEAPIFGLIISITIASLVRYFKKSRWS